MPNAFCFLTKAAIALFSPIGVGLGQGLPDRFCQQQRPVRIELREYATRPLPIFLFSVGAAMLPAAPLAGAAQLLLAGILPFLNRNGRKENA